MKIKVKFSEQKSSFGVKFGEIHEISDGGYERGYSEGYDKGYQVGYGESYDIGLKEGIEQGKKEQYDIFWDSVQNNGTRTNYAEYFYGWAWKDAYFNPKYVIQPTTANRIFFNTGSLVESLYTDKLDFSKCTRLDQAFYQSAITKLKTIDCRNATNIENMFSTCKNLVSIDCLYPPKGCNFSGTFYRCEALKDIAYGSEILTKGLDFTNCTKLSKASIINTINALSSAKTGLWVIFSKTAVNKAFETSEGANDGSSSQEWATLIASKNNWTISLA